MRIVLNAGTVLFASLALVSCGKSEAPVSTVKSSGFSCDLQSSGAASSEASKKAFQCAYNSLKSAGKLAAGGLVTDVANVVDGIKQVYQGAYAAHELYTDLNEFVRNGGTLPPDLAKDAQKIFDSKKSQFEKSEFGKELARKAMYRCLDGSYKSVKDLLSLSGMASGLNTSAQGSGRLTFSQIQSLSSLSFSGIKGLLDRMNTLSECTQWLNSSRTKSLVQLSKGVKQISSSLDIVATVTRCGVDLAKGGYVLYANSACLVEDLKNLNESRQRLDRQRENWIDTAINPEGGKANINRSCMDKYGIFLYKTGPGETFNTRAYMCATYCGNKGRRTAFVQKNFYSIIRSESDRSICRGLTDTVLDHESVNACIVSCCDQKGECSDAAWDKLKYYNL
jgi:hypothetical protein